jgi:hypothetical protein
MTENVGDTKKRGANVMKTGAGMLVFGIAFALGTAGEHGNPALNAFSTLVAIAGLITAIIGLGIWRQRP